MDFEFVWQLLVRSINEDRNVITLAQGMNNYVEADLPNRLMVVTRRGTSFVNKQWIEDAWNVLNQAGTLRANDIPGKAKYRSSFIMALIARLDNVQVEVGPRVRLYLEQPVDAKDRYVKE